MSERMNKLALRQMEKKLDKIKFDAKIPDKGWVRSIRKALGMTLKQLAKRIGVTRPTVSEYEKREAAGTITLNSLRKAAEGLGCRFRYALVPKDSSLKEFREKAARKAAAKLVENTSRSMALEDQEVSESEKEKQVEELKQEFLNEWDNSIWDVEAE